MVTGKMHTIILAGLILLVATCTNPFDTNADDTGDPLLAITATTTSLPIYDSAFVYLSWPQLAVDDFVRFEIRRNFINVVDTIQNKIPVRVTIYDPKITTWQDTLRDDESVHYQLDVFSTNGLVGSSEIDVIIPYTTRINILGGGYEFERTARSLLVDIGDTLQLQPGKHRVFDLDLTRKPILIEGMGSAKDIIIEWYPPPPLSDGKTVMPFFLQMKDGEIRNLTLTGGETFEGGAVRASGNTKLKNCIFIDNTAVTPHGNRQGDGGALYLNDNVEVSNCIIVSNTAQNYGGAIFLDLSANNVKIINTTIYGNLAFADEDLSAIYAPSSPGLLTIKNC